jgi:hypothetical protein
MLDEVEELLAQQLLEAEAAVGARPRGEPAIKRGCSSEHAKQPLWSYASLSVRSVEMGT